MLSSGMLPKVGCKHAKVFIVLFWWYVCRFYDWSDFCLDEGDLIWSF